MMNKLYVDVDVDAKQIVPGGDDVEDVIKLVVVYQI